MGAGGGGVRVNQCWLPIRRTSLVLRNTLIRLLKLNVWWDLGSY